MDQLQMFKNLMVMAAADDKFTDEEINYLSLRANRLGISDQQFHEALVAAQSPQAALEIPPSQEARLKLMKELVRMMAADGELAQIEKDLFAVAAAHMQLTSEDLNAILDHLH